MVDIAIMAADIAIFMADIAIFTADIAIIMANIAILWPKTDCQGNKMHQNSYFKDSYHEWGVASFKCKYLRICCCELHKTIYQCLS